VAALAPVALRAQQLGALRACFSPGCLALPGWWACLAGVSLNYFMHAFIWNCGKSYVELCKGPLRPLGDDPVEVFATLEIVAKVIQGGSLVAYLGTSGLAAAWASLVSAPLVCWAGLAVFVAMGQALNFATYAAIGKVGVYYGFKFGRTVPWCYGFPFNTGLRHPQYLGVVLTLWGALLVLICDNLAAVGIPQLVFAWGAMYVVMCIMEQSGDNTPEEKAQ